MEEDDDSKEVCNFVETIREGSHLVFGAPSFGFWRQITSSSADADKPARRVYGSVKVTKHSTIPYVRYSFQLCNSNFVFKTRRFFTIFDFKNAVILKTGLGDRQGHWK